MFIHCWTPGSSKFFASISHNFSNHLLATGMHWIICIKKFNLYIRRRISLIVIFSFLNFWYKITFKSIYDIYFRLGSLNLTDVLHIICMTRARNSLVMKLFVWNLVACYQSFQILLGSLVFDWCCFCVWGWLRDLKGTPGIEHLNFKFSNSTWAAWICYWVVSHANIDLTIFQIIWVRVLGQRVNFRVFLIGHLVRVLHDAVSNFDLFDVWKAHWHWGVKIM